MSARGLLFLGELMVRSFKKYTITAGGTPQPLIGTKTSAAVGPVPKPKEGVVGPSGLYSIPVLDSSMFRTGDWARIGKPSTGEERLYVISTPDTTHVQVKVPDFGITGTYLSGAYLRLSNLINSTYIQTIQGNAGPIYVGTQDNLSTSTLAFVISLLYPFATPTQPIEYRDGRSGLANADDIGQYWVDGTTADGYLPSFGAM
jgi:hypothetical protein